MLFVILVEITVLGVAVFALLVHIKDTYAIRRASLEEALRIAARKKDIVKDIVVEIAVFGFFTGIVWFYPTRAMWIGSVSPVAVFGIIAGCTLYMFAWTFFKGVGVWLAKERIQELQR